MISALHIGYSAGYQHINLHFAIRENGARFQRSAHGFDIAAQRAQVHIGALFHFGDAALIDVEKLGQPSLDHFGPTSARQEL